MDPVFFFGGRSCKVRLRNKNIQQKTNKTKHLIITNYERVRSHSYFKTVINEAKTHLFFLSPHSAFMYDRPMLFLLPRNLVCYWSLHATIAPPWYFGLSGAPPRLEPPRGIAGSTGSTRRAKVPRKTCVVFVN